MSNGNYSDGEHWPFSAYEQPVVPAQDPYDIRSLDNNQHPALLAPSNPSDLEVDIYRHEWHKDENASTMYDESGRRDGSQGMNTILDGTYQMPSNVQPGIGNILNQSDTRRTGKSDEMDDWSHLIDMMGDTATGIQVRQQPNRDLFLHTHYIPPSVTNSISYVQILGRDPRRVAVTFTNASTNTVFLMMRPSDAQNLPSGGSIASGPIFALVPNYPLRIQYDGDMYAANPSLGTPAYVSLAVERDR